jgi:hypothetical protein
MSIISDWDSSYFLSSFKTDSTTGEYAVEEVTCRERHAFWLAIGATATFSKKGGLGRGLRGRHRFASVPSSLSTEKLQGERRSGSYIP